MAIAAKESLSERKHVVEFPDFDVRIRMFGALEVENRWGKTVENRSRPSVSWLLLKYMLVNPRRVLKVEELEETLWKASVAEEGSAVRVRLRRLRKALEPLHLNGSDGLVLYGAGQYWLNPKYDILTDEHILQKLTVSIRNLEDSDPDGLSLCKEALELFRGQFLEYTYDAEWLVPYQAYYRRVFCELAQTTLERMRVLEDDSTTPLLCARAVNLVPEEESLHRAIISYLVERKSEIELTRYISQLSRVDGTGVKWL